MMTESRIKLAAKDYLADSQVILESAERLAAQVSSALRVSQHVSISMKSMPTISSSFFNLILTKTVNEFGSQAIERLELTDASELMREMFRRSSTAVSERFRS